MIRFYDFLKKEINVLEFQIVRAILDTRKEVGISQEELSKRAGIPQANINRIENDSANQSFAIPTKTSTEKETSIFIFEYNRRNIMIHINKKPHCFLEGATNFTVQYFI